MSIATLAVLLVGAIPPEAAFPREDPAPAVRAEKILVPGSRVRLAPPAGHEAGRGFLGYQWPDSAASLIVLEMPGPCAEVVRGFDEKGLAKGGMKLIEASDARIDGRDARLFLVSQESHGIRFRKWIAIFGDAQRTVMLNAVFPEELAGGLPAALKAALLAAAWDPTLEVDPFAVLPWTLARPEGLRFAGNIGTSLLYTEDGEVVQKDKPASARIVVSPSMGVVDVANARTFAEKRVRALPFGQDLEVESSVDFAAGGRKGWEIVAKARIGKDGPELLVHQVLLVGEGEYHLFVAECGRAQRDTWLPRFRACAASWKLKDAPPAEPK